MTSLIAAQLIDAAHKNYRDALETDREESAFEELRRTVNFVKREQDEEAWRQFLARHGRS